MDFIISLAHFCDHHGPTSILCTQLNPVDCHSCFPCQTPPAEEDVPKTPSFTNSFWDAPTFAGIAHHAGPLLSPFDSLPSSSSPGSHSAWNPYFPGSYSSQGSGESVSRFSVNSDLSSDSCDSCDFLVPQDMSKRLPDGAPGSPRSDGKGRHGSPVLRTTQVIVAPGSCDEEADMEEEEDEEPTNGTVIPGSEEIADPLHDNSPDSVLHSSDSSRSSQSFRSHNSSTHTHNLQYVTTRQPTASSAYSLLRRSCIRTLSTESLPRGSQSGPLYFGDPVAGYTIAYVFRLPDPRSRGKRRMYALIALGGRDSWRVSTAYVMITKAFESIASQIVAMADSVLEKESAASQASRPSTAAGLTTPPLSTSLPPLTTALPQSSPEMERAKSAATSPIQASRISDVSGFLSARKVDPDGFPRVSREVMKAKGLAEIVGKDNFFVELHARFCLILAGLVKEFAAR